MPSREPFWLSIRRFKNVDYWLILCGAEINIGCKCDQTLARHFLNVHNQSFTNELEIISCQKDGRKSSQSLLKSASHIWFSFSFNIFLWNELKIEFFILETRILGTALKFKKEKKGAMKVSWWFLMSWRCILSLFLAQYFQ